MQKDVLRALPEKEVHGTRVNADGEIIKARKVLVPCGRMPLVQLGDDSEFLRFVCRQTATRLV